MNNIYYIEINLICIVILLLIQYQLRHRSERFSADTIVLSELIWVTVLLCASDLVAGVCRGRFFMGARAVIQASNLIYFEALTIISYLWMLYVQIKLRLLEGFDKKRLLFWAIPLIAFTLMALSNPFTRILFTIDENNLYARNVGVYVHWLVTWFYLIAPTVQTVRAILSEQNTHRRRDIMYLLYFIIAPIIASIVQMLFYGVSSSQVGVTVSIVAIFLVVQSRQVLTDALTGLNNRLGLANYTDDFLQRNAGAELAIWMLDLNNFKQVNDSFGHMVGDRALQDAANALKQACREMPSRLFLCRYGGDEFLIAGSVHDPAEIECLEALIRQELDKKNRAEGAPYTLTFGIGTACGPCVDADDVERLIRLADKAMYGDKKRQKAGARAKGK